MAHQISCLLHSLETRDASIVGVPIEQRPVHREHRQATKREHIAARRRHGATSAHKGGRQCRQVPHHRPQAIRRPPKNDAARRVTNAQALGISLNNSDEDALSSLYRRRSSTLSTRTPPIRARAKIQNRAGAPGLRHSFNLRRVPARRRVPLAFAAPERDTKAHHHISHERRVAAGPRQARGALRLCTRG